MNIDFVLLEKSIGKRLKFEVTYILKERNFFDSFYAELREVGNDYIIVEQFLVETNENDKDIIISKKRKLRKGDFTIISKELNLNG